MRSSIISAALCYLGFSAAAPNPPQSDTTCALSSIKNTKTSASVKSTHASPPLTSSPSPPSPKDSCKPSTTTTTTSVTITVTAPSTCTPTPSFVLKALNGNGTTTYLQTFDNAGTFNYEILFGAPGITAAYASKFTFDTTTARLATFIYHPSSPSGSTLYKSVAPSVGQLLNLTTAQSDAGGQLALSATRAGNVVTDTAYSGINAVQPWAQCQIAGFTTGLTKIVYAPDVLPRSDCSRVLLATEPVAAS